MEGEEEPWLKLCKKMAAIEKKDIQHLEVFLKDVVVKEMRCSSRLPKRWLVK
jgi:hypothetical protein